MTLKQIAAQIRINYGTGKFTCIANGRIEFAIDTFIVRCDDNLQSVNKLADKFHKGLRSGGRTQAWPVRPPSMAQRPVSTVIKAFEADGEYENAREYRILRAQQ